MLLVDAHDPTPEILSVTADKSSPGLGGELPEALDRDTAVCNP